MSPYQPVIDPLVIGERQFTSRLMLGTGKYKNLDEAKKSIAASGCQILTVAVRRAQNSTIQSMGNLIT
jgi:thiazole synthase